MKLNKKTETLCWNCRTIVPKIDYKIYKGIPKCPECGCLYPEKPELEAKLSILQDRYLESKRKLEYLKLEDNNQEELKKLDKKCQDELNYLFKGLHDLTFNIICSKLKGSATRREQEDIEDMTQWSLLKLLEYYTSKENFKIKGSFTGYISRVVLYPLYNDKEKIRSQTEVSLDSPINSSEKEQTLLDVLSLETSDENKMFNVFQDIELKSIASQMIDFFKDALKILYSQNLKVNKKNYFSEVIELGVLLKYFIMKKNDRFFSEFWRTCSVGLKEDYEGVLTILRRSLVE